jgi:ornithine carbamoyltransferase
MITRDRVDLGIARKPSRPFTADEDRKARELLADGESLAEVARTLGRNVDTIGKRYRGMGWTPQEIGQYNKLRILRQALELDA